MVASLQEVLHLSYAQLISWADEISERIEAAKKENRVNRVNGCGDAFPTFFLVALLLDRSALALAAILAVWKAGGAYAPVPKDAPFARRKLFCSDADMVIIDKAEFSELHSCTLLLPGLRQGPGNFGITSRPPTPPTPPTPDDLCMVIYTSGSTGQPKGVQCDHRCLWHSVSCFAQDIRACTGTHLLWKTPYQWRTAEYELFAALCFGGTLYIAPEGAQRHFRYLMEVIDTHSITALTTVPSVLSLLVEHLGKCPSLEYMASVGEALPRELCKPFLERSLVLQNYYGLTETGMTTWRCNYIPSGSVAPVGQPQPAVHVQLLSQPDGQAGQEGEIYFSGIMSRGYFNMPELTRERYHEVLHQQSVISLSHRSCLSMARFSEVSLVNTGSGCAQLCALTRFAASTDFKLVTLVDGTMINSRSVGGEMRRRPVLGESGRQVRPTVRSGQVGGFGQVIAPYVPQYILRSLVQVKLNNIRMELAEIEASLSVVCKETGLLYCSAIPSSLRTFPTRWFGVFSFVLWHWCGIFWLLYLTLLHLTF